MKIIVRIIYNKTVTHFFTVSNNTEMDANYLKSNIFDALTEALTSMTIEVPNDKIEYIGQYLLSFCSINLVILIII